MILQKRIHEILKKKGIKIKVLAEEMGISSPALSSMLRSDMRLSSIERIAAALGVSLSELFSEEESEEKETGEKEK